MSKVKQAFKVLKEELKKKLVDAVMDEETCMIKDYNDALYSLRQMERNIFREVNNGTNKR